MQVRVQQPGATSTGPQTAQKRDPYRNPYAFAIRDIGRLPEAPWAQGSGSMRIEHRPSVNVARVDQTTSTRPSLWKPTRNWIPIRWTPHLGARAALTGWGFPSTWFTLRLPLAQPDLQTALSRRMRPVTQKYAAAGGSQIRVPAVFVPVRPTGPAAASGGSGNV